MIEWIGGPVEKSATPNRTPNDTSSPGATGNR